MRAIVLIFLVLACSAAFAQTIRGEVVDNEDKNPVKDVSIENVYTALSISTDDKGAFLIAAANGQLLEFKKPGYKTVRLRIPQGYLPPYFKIIMKRGITEVKNDYLAGRYDYRADSIRMHELYKHELDFPRMSAIDVVAHPFTALSKRNQEMWRFQDEFDAFEKEKYVDMTFNETIVNKITGLTGDSLHSYMRRYRPSYTQLRGMNDYAFYNYIKSTVHHYRTPNMPRGAQ